MHEVTRQPRRSLLLISGTLALFGAALAACSENEGTPSTPTLPPTVPPTVAQTASPTPAPATATPRTPPADGTVDPLNAGSTDPVDVKPDPDPATGQAVLQDVRVGVHPEEGGWERVVFEFRGSAIPGARVEYVSSVAQCGSGQPVTVGGRTVLVVRIRDAAAHDDQGRPTLRAMEFRGPGNTVLEGKQSCDFEGVVEWALGVKDTQRFKVTKLASPPRIVIDIKQ
jgi:hypothetical protein